jgi:DNA (cytosine-5)-methyltransferase 1
MNAIDLFCGCGGASLGLKMAGYKVVGAVDIDTVACETYYENFGLKPICEDLRHFTGQQILTHYNLTKGDIDLVVGCPPCQGFSSLRRTRYHEGTDPRKSLVNTFFKRIQELQPRAVIFENVSGIVSKEGLRYYLKPFLRKMEKIGYKTCWEVINAADYGVPQFRKRIFALCITGSTTPIIPPKTHFDPKDMNATSIWKTVQDQIGNMPKLLPGQSCTSIPNHKARNHSPNVIEVIKHIPKDGGSRKSLPEHLWLPCHLKLQSKKGRGAESIYGRMKWNSPAPTITCRCTTPSSGRFIHPEQDRAITPREAARLQTFPDNFKFPETVGYCERLIGNAVPPDLMKAQLETLSDQL